MEYWYKFRALVSANPDLVGVAIIVLLIVSILK
jgi:hypothetical protein